MSADRVCAENTVGILKGWFSRLKYINTYSITSAAFVLHNFCYLANDTWVLDADENLENNYMDNI